jgi:hypothetical protein
MRKKLKGDTSMKAVFGKLLLGLVSGIAVAAGTYLWEEAMEPGIKKLAEKLKELKLKKKGAEAI